LTKTPRSASVLTYGLTRLNARKASVDAQGLRVDKSLMSKMCTSTETKFNSVLENLT
jgi:hypothetical protein